MQDLETAEKAIRAGWIAGIVSIAMTALMVGTVYFTGEAVMGFDLTLIVDVLLMIGLVVGIYFKSRTCAVLMFVYFLISKILQVTGGQYGGIVLGVIFLYFYGRAAWGTFVWHRLKASHVPVEVFSDPAGTPAPDAKLFR